MKRECDHPTPTAGGKFCIGERKRYRICNTDPCPEGQPTYRALQCSWYNNKTYEGNLYEWQPYFDQGTFFSCKLTIKLNDYIFS